MTKPDDPTKPTVTVWRIPNRGNTKHPWPVPAHIHRSAKNDWAVYSNGKRQIIGSRVFLTQDAAVKRWIGEMDSFARDSYARNKIGVHLVTDKLAQLGHPFVYGPTPVQPGGKAPPRAYAGGGSMARDTPPTDPTTTPAAKWPTAMTHVPSLDRKEIDTLNSIGVRCSTMEVSLSRHGDIVMLENLVDHKLVVKVLEGTLSRIGLPAKWVQGELAQDERKRAVSPSSPRADCWCVTGAMLAETVKQFEGDVSQETSAAYTLARAYLRSAITGGDVSNSKLSIVAWNDHIRRRHAEVVAALQGAIRIAKERANA